FPGGTIGAYSSGGIVRLKEESKSLLLEKYAGRFGNGVTFDELRPLNILSENVQPSDLEVMADCVRGVDKEKYDGIIITHGTDTLCFTANLFSQLFCDIKIPVVFVSALYPLDDERSRGLENFAGAVTFIQSADFGGVFVSFTNHGENCKIHLASRLTAATQISGEYDSILKVHFGEIIGGGFVYNADPLNPEVSQLKQKRKPCDAQKLCMDMVTIQAHSLLNFDFYRFTEVKPKAVMVQLYHSGTVCTKGKEANFVNFLNYCKELGIEVVIAPIDSRARTYGSAVGLADMCIAAYAISFEMATAKVLLALGSGKSLENELRKNNFFEKLY
ncbi:MAG: asparaginase domain-containing protein, partial [Clostridia bacterium]|nr:asparaginase domain-containing protein [Clostridia bacterium]